MQECCLLLLESELNHIKFYIHRYRTFQQPKALEAAFKRLEKTNETLVPCLKTEQYQKAHKDIAEYFAQEKPTQNLEIIEALLSKLVIKQKPVHARNRF